MSILAAMNGTIAIAVTLIGFFGLVAYVTIPALIEGAGEGLAALWDRVPRPVQRWLRPE